MDNNTFADDLSRHFYFTLGRDKVNDSHHYLYNALAITIRDRLVAQWRETRLNRIKERSVAYISLEFLMGRALNNTVLNLDLDETVRESLKGYCCELEEVETAEHDAGLGNGGLGRLAACFLDSCASLALPVIGYGIRYEYGMFNQQIKNGEQVEHPDSWLREGNPWEIAVPDKAIRVKFFGQVDVVSHRDGTQHRQWNNTQDVLAVPYDMPIPGYKNGIVNTLRLWKSEATDEFDLNEFNAGSYTEAVATKNLAEQITMVLYPNDSSENGKELRLRQQYFLSSASLQDTINNYVELFDDSFEHFIDNQSFQLNDTHPSIAIAELMRILIDDYALPWDKAWHITTHTMAYTNHTLLPEALEKWPVRIFSHLLPRILEIIYEINARFLQQVSVAWPGDIEKQRSLSLVEEGYEPQIRMAHLAIVGSYSVNGVAALHTQLLKEGLFNQFYQLWPEKFNNKTNGVTPRRWLSHCNKGLSSLITSKIGDAWIADFSQINQLKEYADDQRFQQQWQDCKTKNKQALVEFVEKSAGVTFDVNMMFDVQVKRIHEYKRQLLNVLHIIGLYDQIRKGDIDNLAPRCVLIGGKAAPGYVMAKQIIKLINNVADTINLDPKVSQYLRVAFVPNYNVTAMEVICPATDLSEQISTAGKEASGTGNMKFMMNGALTIGTLDGANIEIREEVGEDNFFLFGAQAHEIESIRKDYNPNKIINNSPHLSAVMKLLESGHFNLFEPGIFDSIINSIRSHDDMWLTAYDFDSYYEAQRQVDCVFKNEKQWTQMSIINTTASGKFSSDRTIKQYRDEIWKL
ncbi:glycogen/starch/alpha-glucan phosphorylase [Pseudocolwellia sp. AS88]|uniref:glycogen/starch/alpha-glucan phosphorylase n=1 Tax=Pseudocolwellia sp. AS88 TaxID=3063958 RepID=UPI0026EA1FB7|nr:glycogen/starch/alpha-glucan phosphorylase [Pseudocolwellia sp. AS88]MDO7085390.1 glycogen/starch/alpha-glucan phosphorylase [Pseudocolwellia sp. AS88]